MPAIISDIHGNLEALEAVLACIGDEEVICLGDVVCYGPDSIACVQRSAQWKAVVASPLDRALLDHDSTQWSSSINQMIERLRRRFDEANDVERLNRTLKSYRDEFADGGHFYFHGAPGNIREWIFPEEIYCPFKLDQYVTHQPYAYIGGGSHIPGVFRKLSQGWEFIEPENGVSYDLPANGKSIITVGSVGQPRDGDSRAAYAMVNHNSVTFHRVNYDFETTASKIKNDPDIDDMNGDRLLVGT